MRRGLFFRKLSSVILCILFSCNNVFALNAATDLIEHSSGVNPTTNGNTTNITTTHNIDTYHWSQYNLAPNEIANYIFTANGQTALNYLSPGANPSTIYGSIMNSGARGNILLFNPNGIMMGAGASVSGANTFFASTNKFDGIVNGKVTFSEAEKNNPLTIGNIRLNNVNNAHFVAPNVIVKADNINTTNSVSFKAIGGGEYDVNSNLFSNETGVKNPVTKSNMLDLNANVSSNKINIEAKVNSDSYAKALVSGDIKANKAVTGENGEVYIVASNNTGSTNSGIHLAQNANISGESAKVAINAQDVIQNGNIDVSGATGGTVNINAKSYDQNGNISAKGTAGDGGTVKIKSTQYVAVKDATVDVSSTSKGNGGKIDVQGDYQILTSGTYKANSENGNGGKIKISAPLTKIFGADVEASGYTGGGNIFIGGAGKTNEDITDSYFTVVSDGTSIKANSTKGKGGNIYLDSQDTAYLFGDIQAKGSGAKGTGGFIEASSKGTLGINAKINTGGGTFLLDPKNIIIADTAVGGICYNSLLTDGSSIISDYGLNISRQDHFGCAIGLTDHLLAVGANNDSVPSEPRGAVYLFSFTPNTAYGALTLNKKIQTPELDNIGKTKFGCSIGLTDHLLAVGDMNYGVAHTGKVYLYSFNSTGAPYNGLTWLSGINLSPATSSNANFGSAIALFEPSTTGKNGLLAIGASGDKVGTQNAGTVSLYSFKSQTVFEDIHTNPQILISEKTLYPSSTPKSGDLFGSALAVYDPENSSGAGLLAIGSSGKGTDGTVYLTSFTSTTKYSNLTPRVILAAETDITDDRYIIPLVRSLGDVSGYSTGSSLGSSLAFSIYGLSDDGTYAMSTDNLNCTNLKGLLAIGSSGYSKGVPSNSGAVYLFSFNTSSSNPYGHTLELNDFLKDGTTIYNSSIIPFHYTFDLAKGDLFGSAVAMYNPSNSSSPALLAIGSSGYSKDTDGNTFPNSGSMYLLSFDSNTRYDCLTYNYQIQKGSQVDGILTLSSGDLFGSSVALANKGSKNLLAIGAAGDAENCGAVYLFSFTNTYNNITLNTKLADDSPVDPSTTLQLNPGDNFGSSVAMIGPSGSNHGLIAVGASGTDSSAGAAYLFDFTDTYSGLKLDKTIKSNYGLPTITSNSKFGSGIALTNNLLAIGASGNTAKGNSVYLFSINASSPTTNPVLKSTITDAANSNFGSSVAMAAVPSSDTLLAVGATGVNSNQGAVYLYTISGTTPSTSRLTVSSETYGLPKLTNGDNFGSGVALTNGLLAVGASGSNTGSGAAYLFNFSAGTDYHNLSLMQKLENGTILQNSGGTTTSLTLTDTYNFGSSIALYDNSLLAIGASGLTQNAKKCGGVYLFSFIPQTNVYTKYGQEPSSTVYISPSYITGLLGSNDVDLQANNDITVLNAISATSNNLHKLTLEAGRSININANIITGNANLDILANQNVAPYTVLNPLGIWPEYRDEGAATITMASGTKLDAGTGTLNIQLRPGQSGATEPKYRSGDITLAQVSGKTVDIENQGLTTGSSVKFLSTGTGNKIDAGTGGLTIKSSKGSIDNSAGTTESDGNAYVNAATTIKFGKTTVGDNTTNQASSLTAVAGGAITQSNLIKVANNTKLYTPNSITLDNTGNDFGFRTDTTASTARQVYIAGSETTPTTTPAASASITDADTLIMGDVYVSGDLTLKTIANSISQCAGTAIIAGGITDLTSKTFTQLNLLNDFKGTVKLNSGTTANINDINNLTMGQATSNGTMTLSAGRSLYFTDDVVTNNGNFIATANTSNPTSSTAEISMTSGKSINAGTGNVNITLLPGTGPNTASGDITLTQVSGKKVDIENQGPTKGAVKFLSSGASNSINAGTDGLIISSTGAIDTSDGTTTSAGNANYNAGTTIKFGNTTIGTTSSASTLTSTAGGQITQSDAIKVFGTTSLTAGTIDSPEDITLDNNNNDFVDAVSVKAGNTVKITDANSLIMGASTVKTELDLTALGGTITQTGALTVPGLTNLIAASNTTTDVYDVILNNPANDFGTITITKNPGPVIAPAIVEDAAGNVTIDDANGIIIGKCEVKNNLTVNGNHNNTTTTPSDITTDSTITAGGNVYIGMLNNPNAGNISLNTITANTIKAWNQSTTAGTNVIVNGVLTGSGDNGIPAPDASSNAPIILCSDAGDFINTYGSNALIINNTTGQPERWLVYTGSPATTTLNGLNPVNTYYSTTIYSVEPNAVVAGDSVLYRTPNPTPTPTPAPGPGGGGAIVGGTVGGAAAAGAAAGAYGLGLFPGLLLGLAAPIQFDETMLDVICNSAKDYPLLVRNMQYVYQICDICKLDPCTIGSAKFIPDLCINNDSYQMLKVKIPQKFANSPKGITVRITQKSSPFGISKNVPDMNFNVFNTASDKKISSIYETRRFLRPNYMRNYITQLRTNSKIDAKCGIVQKTILIKPNETKNDLSIVVNYLKNGQFPRKNSSLKLARQAYSMVIQFAENK